MLRRNMLGTAAKSIPLPSGLFTTANLRLNHFMLTLQVWYKCFPHRDWAVAVKASFHYTEHFYLLKYWYLFFDDQARLLKEIMVWYSTLALAYRRRKHHKNNK